MKLSVAVHITEAHGGTLQYEQLCEKGMIFRMSIPVETMNKFEIPSLMLFLKSNVSQENILFIKSIDIVWWIRLSLPCGR